MEELSVCRVYDCAECKYRRDAVCLGCFQGNVFLAKLGREPCKVFACARSQGLGSCLDCTQSVCLLRGSTDTVCPLRAGIENKRHWAWRIADHLESKGAPCQKEGTAPLKTIMRLRWYLTALGELKAKGENVVSSRELAERVGMNSAMVRRDLSFFGELGTPGLGYRVDYLEDQIRGILCRNTCAIVWVGAQSLAGIVSMFDAALGLNFKVVAALDSRPEWVGRQVGEWTIRALSELPDVTSGQTIDGAILALPEDAMHAADVLVEAGIKAILNLTPITLKLPPDVTVHHIDLIGEMMALASEAAPPKTGDA